MVLAAYDVGGGRGEVEGLALQLLVFASGEGEERIEQPLLAIAAVDDELTRRSQLGEVCVGVREGEIGEHDLQRELVAQLVRGEGGEALHRSLPRDETGHDCLGDEAADALTHASAACGTAGWCRLMPAAASISWVS